jgi:Uri superfamily endonuclease
MRYYFLYENRNEIIGLVLRGVYVLLISVSDRVQIGVGALGLINLEPGMYAYVGSGRGSNSSSIEGRLSRHCRNYKKKHWHIDYILKDPKVKLKVAIYSKSRAAKECNLVKMICNYESAFGIKDFGSSDCSCVSHLIFLNLQENTAKRYLLNKFIELGLKPQIWKIKS